VRRAGLAAALLLALQGPTLSACLARQSPLPVATTPAPAGSPLADDSSQGAAGPSLAADLDALFDDPALAHAVVAVRIASVRDGRMLYARNASVRLIPASNLKIITAVVAADRLGWDFRFVTSLERTGTVVGGILTGDLIVVGSGDPSIAAQDLRTAPVFTDWASALHDQGIRRVEGRLIGDDDAFDDEVLGAGWAWDYLAAGYAAPSSALSYNENVAVGRIAPGLEAGAPAILDLGPPGHGLRVRNRITTGPSAESASVSFARLPGSTEVVATGVVPAGGSPLIRTTTVDNPTRYFVEALRLALADRGIEITGGAWDADDLDDGPGRTSRQPVAVHQSLPLSSLTGYMMKASQNFYGDMLLKAIGRSTGAVGSTASGRDVVRDTLERWGLPVDALVMYDGSGLSRYNYASTELLVGVLAHAWQDERLRGSFVASLPVGGHDGTLATRMRGSALDRRVQAKTGTISNVRALSGYADTRRGDKLVFAMIANNFVVPNAAIDAIMERALERLLE
jgi:D-alanyl-D-alanine carboxypeptidase/D-alanyl-D-alanine-endopeptidase (penicillin-binding protein 4)